MIDLSIVIVNYNVKHFLQHCLSSLRAATKKLSVEIIVVDNSSVDGSVGFIKEHFPEVNLIALQENLGFSKANNIAIRQAKGKYILLLNPDTVVQEDTLLEHIQYAETSPEIAAIGAKMIDGSGKYLPESKRGFPVPRTALFKMLGIHKLFPNSRFFNGYYLGQLKEDAIHEVDVLTGAYFLVKRKVLDEVGLLDEAFFMYGEDIDLSFRIKKAGYKIIYHPHNPIIHYKGESTKKASFNYVRHFYKAMIIFSRKHFKKERAGLLSFILSAGIYMKASLSLFKRFFHRFGMYLVLALSMIMSLFGLARFWASYRYQDPGYYEDAPLLLNFGLYTVFWIGAAYLSDLFTQKSKLYKLIRNLSLASLILLAIYGLLNMDYRSSRAILILGFGAAIFTCVLLQIIWNFVFHKSFKFSGNQIKNVVIVGSQEECQRVTQIINQSEIKANVVGFVSPGESDYEKEFLTHAGKLDSLVKIENLDEVVFCLKDINIHEVMQHMSKIGGNIEYKIIGDESLSIVGSKSKNTPGEWYSVDIQFSLNKRSQRISKRIFDVLISVFIFLLSPILIFFQSNKSRLLRNIWEVFIGKKTWVSYGELGTFIKELPKLKGGILHPLSGKNVEYIPPLSIKRANLMYAKEYQWNKDLEIIWRGLSSLGGC